MKPQRILVSQFLLLINFLFVQVYPFPLLVELVCILVYLLLLLGEVLLMLFHVFPVLMQPLYLQSKLHLYLLLHSN